GPRTDEIVEIMRRLWTEETVAFDGEFYSFPEVGFEPKPVRAQVPILVGGETGPAQRRAARIGDGWFGMGHTPDQARERVRHLQTLREAAGRGDEPLEITVQCAVPPTVENFQRYEEAGVDRVTLSARSFTTRGRSIESAVEGLEEFADTVLSRL
ncbi:MAG: LLM class flavin-dependent oxidoreductase, partial [Dehalococcoidia bacterium]